MKMNVYNVRKKSSCVVALITAVAMLFFATGISAGIDPGKTILVEAESFDDYGGWSLDTQFMDQMGSPYLIAHGICKKYNTDPRSIYEKHLEELMALMEEGTGIEQSR